MPAINIKPYGGINTFENPNEIADNQCKNMQNFSFRDGCLKIRPELVQYISHTYGDIVDIYPRDGSTIRLIDYHYISYIGNPPVDITRYGMYFLTQTKIGYISDNVVYVHSTNYNLSEDSFFVDDGDSISENYGDETEDINATIDKVLKIFRNDVIYKLCTSYEPTIASTSIALTEITGIYTPTVYINCNPSGAGDRLEDRNLISPKVIQKFTTNNTATVYQLLDTNIDNTDLEVDYDNLSGTTLTFLFSAGETSKTAGGITCTLNRTNGTLTFSVALANASASGAANNMVVYYSKTITGNYSKISNCTIGSYYGGNLQGQESGNRLFLSGNPSEPNKIYWSDVNNLLYFPEYSFNSVGQPYEKITAFGKAFDTMIVFKEKSTWRVTYEYNGEVAYFPVSEVSNSIGCDMPDSVQLINNDLVWCNSYSGVYLLRSTLSSVADERIVRQISRNCNSLIFAESNLQNAVSLDYKGNYYLFVNDKVFIWNYDKTPYQYMNTDDEQRRLSWYVWKLPVSAAKKIPYVYNGEINFVTGSGAYKFSDSGLEGYSDKINGLPSSIDAYFYLKDFADPEYIQMLKNTIWEIYTTGGTVEFLFDENGTEQTVDYLLTSSEEEEKQIVEMSPPYYSFVDHVTAGISPLSCEIGVSNIVVKFDTGKFI